jgi:hypothetical protein
METTDGVTDSRAFPRFVLLDPITGYFGGTDIRIIDISEGGMQIEHAEAITVRAKARVGFRLGDVSTSLTAILVWSCLSKTTNQQGGLFYRSGIKVDDPEKRMSQIIGALAVVGRIRPDQPLERKRAKLAALEQAKRSAARVKVIGQSNLIPNDQFLLIQHAREYLRSHPKEALNWYNRAKYAIASEETQLHEMNLPHREEVFAVWEYLERSIGLVTIARAFEMMKQP